MRVPILIHYFYNDKGELVVLKSVEFLNSIAMCDVLQWLAYETISEDIRIKKVTVEEISADLEEGEQVDEEIQKVIKRLLEQRPEIKRVIAVGCKVWIEYDNWILKDKYVLSMEVEV